MQLWSKRATVVEGRVVVEDRVVVERRVVVVVVVEEVVGENSRNTTTDLSGTLQGIINKRRRIEG
jgi:hypothetical protein